MPVEVTPRQLLTAIYPGQHHVLLDPKQPGKVICQAIRQGDVYYLTGPLFSDLTGIELQPLFEVGWHYGDNAAATMGMLNKYLSDHGAPSEALAHMCTSLEDAINTLDALFAAYSLPPKAS